MMLNPAVWFNCHSSIVLRHSAKRPFPSCTEGKVPSSVPPLMGLSLAFGQPRRLSALGKCLILVSATALACSCDKHHPGEYPEVQRDKMHEPSPVAAEVEAAPMNSPTPAAK